MEELRRQKAKLEEQIKKQKLQGIILLDPPSLH